MILGQVRGHLWATKKNPWLREQKLLIVKPYFWYDPDHNIDHIICVDPVGAEVGQDVIVCIGAPCRWILGDIRFPTEASIMAIVDRTEIYRDIAEMPDLPFKLKKGNIPQSIVWRYVRNSFF